MIDIDRYLENEKEKINKALDCYLPDNAPAAVTSAMRYSLEAGGKRLRPILTIAVAESLGNLNQDLYILACAVEMIHTYSLIHDDLPAMDNSDLRRGKPTCHRIYGDAVAILAGDALYTLAFEVLGQISKPSNALACTRILASYTKTYGMIGGQAVALESKRKVMKINTLRFIDMKKEGSLMQATADMACNLAGTDENTRQTMNSYAMNLTMAYQMIDDISADYNRGSEGLDFDEEFVPTSRRTYTGLLGFDKTRNAVEKLLDETNRMIQPFEHNDVLGEFVQMIQERLP